MKQANPKVEVLVFTYNQEPFIREALESILMQETEFPISIRIHDDCSTDSTVEAALSVLQGSQIPFEIYQPDSNRFSEGMSFFGEEVLRSGQSSDYIALLDGDDIWTDKSKLQKQIELLESNKSIALCHHPFGTLENAVVDESDWRPAHLRGGPYPGHALSEMNFIGASTVVLRSRMLPKKLPESFARLPIGDYPLWALVTDRAFIGEVEEVMSLYRLHDNSVFSALDRETQQFRELVARAFMVDNSSDESRPYWAAGLSAFVLHNEGFHLLKLENDRLLRLSYEQVQEIDLINNRLRELSAELDGMRSSISWRISSPLRRVRAALNMKNSRK